MLQPGTSCKLQYMFLHKNEWSNWNRLDKKQNVWYWNNYSVYQETYMTYLNSLQTEMEISLTAAPEISLEVKKREFTVWVLWALCLYSAGFVRTLNSPYYICPVKRFRSYVSLLEILETEKLNEIANEFESNYIFLFPNSREEISVIRSEIRDSRSGHRQPLPQRHHGPHRTRYWWCYGGGLWCHRWEDLLGWCEDPNYKTSVH